jgi:hypothetical protein
MCWNETETKADCDGEDPQQFTRPNLVLVSHSEVGVGS